MKNKIYPHYKSITRLDYPKKYMFGWLVRVTFNGQMVSKYFMDSQYDSPEEALEAAVDFRNETERELGKRRSERVVVTKVRGSQPAIVGVHRRSRNAGTKIPSKVDVYEVVWVIPEGKTRRTYVSIRKYGEEGAFQRACEIRRAKECQYYTEQGC
jgi:hypothetical protein